MSRQCLAGHRVCCLLCSCALGTHKERLSWRRSGNAPCEPRTKPLWGTALAFWGAPRVCKGPGKAEGWLMWLYFLLPRAIKESWEKAVAALRCAPVPRRDADGLHLQGQLLFTDTPNKGMGPYNRPQTHWLERLCTPTSHYLLMPEALQILLFCEWHRQQLGGNFLNLNFLCRLNA